MVMSEAVTMPSLKMMASTVSEESLVRYTQTHTFYLVYLKLIQSRKQLRKQKQNKYLKKIKNLTLTRSVFPWCRPRTQTWWYVSCISRRLEVPRPPLLLPSGLWDQPPVTQTKHWHFAPQFTGWELHALHELHACRVVGPTTWDKNTARSIMLNTLTPKFTLSNGRLPTTKRACRMCVGLTTWNKKHSAHIMLNTLTPKVTLSNGRLPTNNKKSMPHVRGTNHLKQKHCTYHVEHSDSKSYPF